MKKKLVIAGVVVVLLAAITIGNVRRAKGAAISVELVKVGRKELVAHVTGSGRIEAKKSVSVTANVVGKVLEVAVDEGDAVTKGQLILRIDPGERRAVLQQGEADVARWKAEEELSQAELRQSETELRRVEGMMKSDLATQQSLEERTTDREIRVARLASIREQSRNARAALEYARRELDKTEVRAEISGVVVRLAVEEGENVLAGDLYNQGSSIVEIADLAQMEAHVLVDETEVVQVKRDQPAEVKVDAFPDDARPGRVTEVGNSAYNPGILGSQESKDFRVKVLLDSTRVEALRPGLSVSAKIETDRRPNALGVPVEALTIRDPKLEVERARVNGQSRGGAKKKDAEIESPADSARGESSKASKEVEGVFVVREGRAVFVPVKTGIAGEKDFEVLEGLTEGEEIVRGPFDALRKLESGQKVKPAKKSGGADDKKKRGNEKDAEDEAPESETP